MKKLLFVCVENSNRSQMAEAFGKIHGGEEFLCYSAGSRPSGKVNPMAIEAMDELDYDLNIHESLPLSTIEGMEFEAVISMGCGEDCPFVPSKLREDWGIPDPKHLSPKEYRLIRDYIGIKVRLLIESLRD